MPKLKTNRSVKKRVRISKTGKVKHFRAGRRHILTSKRSKRKRLLRRPGLVRGSERKTIITILPHGA